MTAARLTDDPAILQPIHHPLWPCLYGCEPGLLPELKPMTAPCVKVCFNWQFHLAVLFKLRNYRSNMTGVIVRNDKKRRWSIRGDIIRNPKWRGINHDLEIGLATHSINR